MARPRNLSFIPQLATGVIDGALDLLLPAQCAYTGQPSASALSPEAIAHLPSFQSPYCSKCMASTKEAALSCEDCRNSAYDFVAAIAPYKDWWRQLIYRVKFGHDQSPIPAFATLLADLMLTEEPTPPTLLVPIPSASRRSLISGTRLPERLAKQVSQRLQLPWSRMLISAQPRRPQRSLERKERRALASEFFALRSLPASVDTIWLIDDIMTTGATLRAATECIKNAYPGLSVAAFVLARANKKHLDSQQ